MKARLVEINTRFKMHFDECFYSMKCLFKVIYLITNPSHSTFKRNIFWTKILANTTGMDFPWDYSIIPDIPQLSHELTLTFPVYTQTSPDGNLWMPGLFPDIPWGIPSLPWLPPKMPWETNVSPVIPWCSPLMARTIPWHSLRVTWGPLKPTDIPC